jgi:Mg-chelatase subunit ChlD
MKRFLVVAMIAALALGAVRTASAEEAKAPAAADKPVAKAEKPKVEVVFVLDTTGSMSGLIEAAKQKVWAIANTLAMAKPTPEIKMGLVAYRDKGDEYVTKMTKLTDDLDAVYADLMGYKAAGGGDEPESVNQALNEAVTKMPWTKEGKVYKVIFLVGDAPPHMEYTDDVKYPETCKLASELGITINSIQCGQIASTTPLWTEIAQKAEGKFFRVEQSGGAILATTPFDASLAEASKKLEDTRVFYGDAATQKANLDRAAKSAETTAAAPAAGAATRAIFNAGAAGEANLYGTQELLKAVADGKVKLDDVKKEELPENMQKMNADERVKFVAAKQAEREKIQKEITDLAAKRQAFMEEQAKKAKSQTLEGAIMDSVRDQAGKRGIEYGTGGPAL